MSQAIGAAIVVFLTVDVFLTVFHAQGHAGPFTRLQMRAVWALARMVGVRRHGPPRDALLGLAAPFMVVLTLALWVLLLVIGFALIYLPHVQSFLFSPGGLRTPWWEALYYSGYTAATLGLGDMVPDLTGLRLLTVLEAFTGFALLSVSVTYMLAVYRELIAKRSLASDIAGYFRTGVTQVRHFMSGEGRNEVARWTEDITSSLLHVMEAHFQYPVLHYYRSSDPDRALPLQLAPLLRTFGDDSPRQDPVEHHPSLRSMRDAVRVYLMTVEDVFIPRRFHAAVDSGDSVERAHRRLLSYMAYDPEAQDV
ncbi:MAG TPA: potassium channel family protein [Longimicrobiales bacterium]|nr:potassium channel family protein [Longimicrobiales bacterium]